ncbi:MAG TPA: AraC family transcriptional regulator [Polyangiaceae bacterium]
MRPVRESLVPSAEESFRFSEFSVKRFDAPWHFHPEYELTLIVTGRGVRWIGDHVGRFSDGDLVLVGSNLPHCWLNDHWRSTKLAHAVVVQFRDDFLGEPFFSRPELAGIRRLMVRSSRGLRFRGVQRDKIAAELRQLADARDGWRLVKVLSALQLCSEADAVDTLSSAGYQPRLNDQDASRLNRTYRYLFEHLEEPVRLEQVAKVAHMTPQAFCRYFKQHSGKTLTSALNELRIANVCRLLLESDASISQACYSSGYNNLTHFNRQFVRRMGITPSGYRLRHQTAARTVPAARRPEPFERTT